VLAQVLRVLRLAAVGGEQVFQQLAAGVWCRAEQTCEEAHRSAARNEGLW
jgi:hypothetical protein